MLERYSNTDPAASPCPNGSVRAHRAGRGNQVPRIATMRIRLRRRSLPLEVTVEQAPSARRQKPGEHPFVTPGKIQRHQSPARLRDCRSLAARAVSYRLLLGRAA